jgi:uncharacterized protein DUF4261
MSEPEASAPDGTRRAMAMLALHEAKLPPPGAVRAALERSGAASHRVTVRDGALTVELEGATGVAGILPSTMPRRDLLALCERAWYWPAAAEEMSAHGALAVVGVDAPRADRVDQSLLLTRLVAAIASDPNVIGIVWGDVGLVHSREEFVKRSDEASRELLPLELWIGFHGIESSPGKLSLATDGMREFDLPEIEVRDSTARPDDVYALVFNAAHYLFDHGPVLEDGHTFGLNEKQRIAVKRVPSSTDPSQTAILLQV